MIYIDRLEGLLLQDLVSHTLQAAKKDGGHGTGIEPVVKSVQAVTTFKKKAGSKRGSLSLPGISATSGRGSVASGSDSIRRKSRASSPGSTGRRGPSPTTVSDDDASSGAGSAAYHKSLHVAGNSRVTRSARSREGSASSQRSNASRTHTTQAYLGPSISLGLQSVSKMGADKHQNYSKRNCRSVKPHSNSIAGVHMQINAWRCVCVYTYSALTFAYLFATFSYSRLVARCSGEAKQRTQATV